MAHSTNSSLCSGTVVGERFTIRRPLGHGGMASVYEAHDTRLRQRVAIKVLSSAFASDPGAVERFFREARAVVLLRNQHVVRVFDVGTLPDGAPYLAMEFLDGQSLAALLSSSGPLPVSQVVDFTLQTLEALAEAHRAGIVHRDLKPDNLMLVRGEDALPQIKVIDFGISKLVGPEFTLKNLTLDSSFLGSPLYASPEQLNDAAHVDARTDLWSLGVVMYELLAGEPPFNARSASALMVAICSDEPRRLEDLRADVPRELADVVARCLSKHVAFRFASARELAQALAPFAPGSQSRMSVARIARVHGNAWSQSSERASTLFSLPPAWTSATMIPPPPREEPPRRGRAVSVVALALAVGAVGAIAFTSWIRARGAETDARANASQRREALVAPSVEALGDAPSEGRAAPVTRLSNDAPGAPASGDALAVRTPELAPSNALAPPPFPVVGGATPSRRQPTKRSLAAPIASEGDVGSRAAMPEASAAPEMPAAPPAASAGAPSRAARRLDTSNPFAPGSPRVSD
ncbi:MAG TPA: protein kinase [Polyangiaceae bacterium]|nr:protein kinase [Polyangiaceae bacterium]